MGEAEAVTGGEFDGRGVSFGWVELAGVGFGLASQGAGRNDMPTIRPGLEMPPRCFLRGR
jgi:hypothetical protein